MLYRLVPASSSDKRWLEDLWRAAYHDLSIATWGSWDESRFVRHFAECWERGNICTVALDGERVGMIQLIEHQDSVEVSEIQIHPLHQGRGIGTLLLQDALAKAHARNKKVFLSTGLQNHGAVRLYERLGFQHVRQSETHLHMESGPET